MRLGFLSGMSLINSQVKSNCLLTMIRFGISYVTKFSGLIISFLVAKP